MKLLEMLVRELLMLTMAFASLSVCATTAFPGHADKPWYVVSDIDDTVKLTNVNHPIELIYRAVFSKKAFVGMSTLYRELEASRLKLRGSSAPTFFVSGSPALLGRILQDFLVKNNFPERSVTLLRKFSQPTQGFKLNTIARILSESAGEAAILVGDDGELDPETYHKLSQSNVDDIGSVYIHRVEGRQLFPEQLAFDTAMDIALHEVDAGRLTEAQAIRIGNEILAEKNDHKIVMPRAFCPTDGQAPDAASLPRGTPALLELATKIRDRVTRICMERHAQERQELAAEANPNSLKE